MKCGRCQHENSSSARFCEQCGASLAQAFSQPRFGSPETYTPAHLAQQILTSRASLEGERKRVTVLFADLKGSMELLAKHDPEDARNILDPVLERMMEAVHRYEGTVNQVMGDGIMALFGAPLAHEDHAIRACYAALRMQEAVKAYAADVSNAQGPAIQIRVGLNSGEVVVRSIGSDLHMDYSAVGQTTHLAARMEQIASPGSIVLTAGTRALVENFIEVRSLGPAQVKGLAKPIEVYEATGAGAVKRRFDASAIRGLSKFAGRHAEVEQLRKALDEARHGRGRVVSVVGEPGIGKSRLFHEFVHSSSIADALVLESGSFSYGKATPYLPLVDLLKAYFWIEPRHSVRRIREKVTHKLLALDPALEPALPALLTLLGVPVEELQWKTLDPSQRRTRMLDACKRLLIRRSQAQPLVVVFEDLHWIDSETQAFLDSLVASLPDSRILLLVNYRPEYTHGWGSKPFYIQLRVEPLGPESTNELLNALLGDDPAVATLKHLLVESTGGNPFFVEESVRALVETNALVGSRGSYRLQTPVESIQVPATVQAILAARIDRLPSDEKHLLQIAAVIGHEVPFRVLGAVAEESEEQLRSELAHLQASEFLYEQSLFPELEYGFKHALTHEVAYQGLLHSRRKALHARVMDAIEQLHENRLAEQVETLARHAVRAEAWEKSVDYLSQAGAQALTQGALEDVFSKYEQALEASSRLARSVENLRRAVDVRVEFVFATHPLGQTARGFELLQQAEEYASELGDERRRAVVASRMCLLCWMAGRYREGVEHGRRALAFATTDADPELRMRTLHILSVNYGFLGDFRSAIQYLVPATDGPDVEASKRLPSAVAVSNYVGSCSWRSAFHSAIGEFELAEKYADRAMRFADVLAVPRSRAFACMYRGGVHLRKGEASEALTLFPTALRIFEDEGARIQVAAVLNMTGRALAEIGRAMEGVEHCRRAFALRKLAARGRVTYASTLLLAGCVREAMDEARQALDQARSSGDRASEADALHILGNATAATEPGGQNVAGAFYAQALALAQELEMRPAVAHCHLDLGRFYRRSGDQPKAREHLDTAATMYREMDMRSYLMRAEAELLEKPS